MTAPQVARGLGAHFPTMRRLGRFRLTHELLELDEKLTMLGLPERPVDGDTILPRSMGAHSRFNADGRERVRRDLPKTRTPIVYSTHWNDAHGNRQRGVRTRVAEMRQRQRTPAPHEYLTVFTQDDRLQLSSRVLTLADDSQQTILHLMNLFKEIFGTCTVTAADFQRTAAVAFRKRHWKIALENLFSYEEARAALDELLRLLKEGHRGIIERRIAEITELEPDFLAVGIGGFSDYFVFGFRSRGKYVFESLNLGNATYIFQSDWPQLAQLSKTQILQEGLQQGRIIHDRNWSLQFREAIKAQRV